MTRTKPLAAIVLAAGKGTRMKSALPKVLHPVAGLTILGHILQSLRGLGATRVAVVVAPDQTNVAECARAFGAEPAIQQQQLGTGDAARAALPLLEGFAGDVLILYG